MLYTTSPPSCLSSFESYTMLLCLYNVYKTHADHPVFESDVRRAFQILFETNNEIPTYNGSFIYIMI